MRGLTLPASSRQWTICLTMLGGLAPASVYAQNYQYAQPQAIKQLTIAAWIVQVPSDEAKLPSGTAQKSTWRNTFGRERKTARWRKLGKRSIDADIVVLKRLKSLADVRRLFPARTHQVIASRAALASVNNSTALIAGEQIKPSPFTYETYPAIAIRRRRGLRVTAIRHITTQTKGTGLTELDTPPRHIALAARIHVTGRFVWILTPIVDVTCNRAAQDRSNQRGSPIDCPTGKPPIDQIHRWLRKLTDQQTPIIIATTTRQSARKQPEERKNKPPTTTEVTQTTPREAECKQGQRPTIVTADQLPTDIVEVGQAKPSADRPCAAIAQLNYKD